MTTRALLVIVIALIAEITTGRSPRVAAQSPPVNQLEWMAGCWSTTRADAIVEEHWMKPAGGTMLGMSRTVRGGNTTEHEFLQIRDVKGTLSYVAQPSGQAVATFTLRTATGSEAVFENPKHDFPQRIIYRRTPDGLSARVEGTRNGQLRGIDYAYKRCS
jgi:hypothetical protein